MVLYVFIRNCSMIYINHTVSMLQVDKQKQSKGKGKPGETLEKVLPH